MGDHPVLVLSSLPAALFHGDGPGKEDVVFEMDMVLQPLFEEFDTFHEQPVCGAAVVRGGVSVGQAMDFPPAFPFGMVFGHHDGDRAFEGSAIKWTGVQSQGKGFGHFVDIGEEDLLFLVNVVFKVVHGVPYQLVEGAEFGVAFIVRDKDFFGQFDDECAFAACPAVVEFPDVVQQEVGGPALEIDGEISPWGFFFQFFQEGLAVDARFLAGFPERDVSLTAEIDAVASEEGGVSVIAGHDLACGHGIEFFHVCSGGLQVFFQF